MKQVLVFYLFYVLGLPTLSLYNFGLVFLVTLYITAALGILTFHKNSGAVGWVIGGLTFIFTCFLAFISSSSMTSASQYQKMLGDVTYVTDYLIKYQPNGWFGENLKRHVRRNGYRKIFFTDDSFEIDDNSNPYWVYTKYERTMGFGGRDAVGTIVVNAVTGEINEYSIKDTPLWVDRIQPLKIVHEQITNWVIIYTGGGIHLT